MVSAAPIVMDNSFRYQAFQSELSLSQKSRVAEGECGKSSPALLLDGEVLSSLLGFGFEEQHFAFP